MINEKTVLAVIPARGGSKGLPRKNILPLVGKPLIAWSIEAAHESKYIDKCIVSTESDEIANLAKEYGASVPFMRPSTLATVQTPSSLVYLHALETLQEDYDIAIPTIVMYKIAEEIEVKVNIELKERE